MILLIMRVKMLGVSEIRTDIRVLRGGGHKYAKIIKNQKNICADREYLCANQQIWIPGLFFALIAKKLAAIRF